MAGNKRKVLMLLIIGALLILSPFVYLLVSGQEISALSLKQKKVTCDVTVKNPLPIISFSLGEVRFGDINCRASEASIFNFGFFSIFDWVNFSGGKLKLFPDEIAVTFYAGGKSVYTKEKVGEAGDISLSLSLTVSEDTNTGVVQLIKGNVIIQQQNVNF